MTPRSILLIEDESQALSTLIPMLSRWNTHVEVFRNIAQLTPDVIGDSSPTLLLHCRPGELLLNAIAAVRANCPQLLRKCIVVTPSVPDERSLEAMRNAAVYALAVRPFAAGDLATVMERCASGFLPPDPPMRLGVARDSAVSKKLPASRHAGFH